MSKKNLIIIGASGHGKVVAEIAELTGQYDSINFMDDFSEKKTFHGYKNLGSAKRIEQYKEKADFFVAIGDNHTREIFLKKLISDRYSLSVLIHPKAIVSDSTTIGVGSVIMPGTVLNSSVTIGKGCIVNTNSSVDHDCVLEDYTHLSPGVTLAGSVKIGKRTWLGANSTAINNIKIASDCVIGAASLILDDIEDKGTYVGAPVRRIKE